MSDDIVETCPFILTKGIRKGQVCGEKAKNKDSSYCRAHLRTIGVKMELGSDLRSRSSEDLRSLSTKPRPVDRKYEPVIVGDIPKKPEPNTKKSFATAFSKHIDKKLSTQNDNIDMDEIYNDVDIADDIEDDDIPYDDEDPSIKFYKKELEAARNETLKAQRRINSMFTMKQLLFTGVKTVADIGEKIGGEKLTGYSHQVMTSDAVNSLLDEMSDDMETILGFSEQPASIRLLATMGVIGSSVYAKNTTGVSVKEINPQNVPPIQPQQRQDNEPETPEPRRFKPYGPNNSC